MDPILFIYQGTKYEGLVYRNEDSEQFFIAATNLDDTANSKAYSFYTTKWPLLETEYAQYLRLMRIYSN